MKPAFLLLCSLLMSLVLSAQTKITGTVSDDLGILPLANISIKNSKQGTTTNENGNFFIEAKSTDTLQFSYLGYKTKEVVVGKQSNIKMVFDSYEELDLVVINAYGGATKCSLIICTKRTGCGSLGLRAGTKYDNYKTQEAIVFYPNPSTDGIFTIKLLEDISDVNISVSDITGRIIVNRTERKFSSNIVVDLSDQPSGIYIINVSANGERITSKKALKV